MAAIRGQGIFFAVFFSFLYALTLRAERPGIGFACLRLAQRPGGLYRAAPATIRSLLSCLRLAQRPAACTELPRHKKALPIG